MNIYAKSPLKLPMWFGNTVGSLYIQEWQRVDLLDWCLCEVVEPTFDYMI